MPPLRVPSYRLHKPSGLAVVSLSGHDHYLGPHGSSGSKEAYERLIAQWLASNRAPIVKPDAQMKVSEVLSAYLEQASKRYQGGTWDRIKAVCKVAISLFGKTQAKEFKGRAVKAVRAKMVASGLNRRTVNQRIDYLKIAWRWALSEELVPTESAQSVFAVVNLREGEVEGLPEPKKVPPVPIEVVNATLPYLSPYLADVARLQLAAGMRPGEALAVRADELEVISSDLWLWRPKKHKTAHRGHHRQVYLGPAAIAIAEEYLERAKGGYLFSPRRAREERFARMRANRKNRVQPSQQDRSKDRPKKAPGERYKVTSYSQAVRKAARKAGVEHWHPHQLRHTAGTIVAQQHGWEAARLFLGHKSLDTTRIYAEDSLERMAEIVRRMK